MLKYFIMICNPLVSCFLFFCLFVVHTLYVHYVLYMFEYLYLSKVYVYDTCTGFHINSSMDFTFPFFLIFLWKLNCKWVHCHNNNQRHKWLKFFYPYGHSIIFWFCERISLFPISIPCLSPYKYRYISYISQVKCVIYVWVKYPCIFPFVEMHKHIYLFVWCLWICK